MTFVLLGGLTILLCGIDLWCKSQVEQHMQKGEDKPILKNRIILRKVHNKGMAFNFAEKRPKFVRALSLFVCIVVFVGSLLVWNEETSILKKVGMAILLSGAISNTYDRMKREYVVDYFSFKSKWKRLSRLTFNLGDFFIFIGAVCYVITEFKQS